MSETEFNTVECPACHRRFVWKPELSGKAVKCNCGKAFAIPSAPQNLPLRGPAVPRSAEAIGAGDFEAQPTERPAAQINCPSCNLPMKPGASICLNCGFDIRQGGKVRTKVLGTHSGPPPLGTASGLRAPDFITPQDHSPPATPGTSRSRVSDALIRREDDQDGSRFIDFYLPIIFIVAGVALTVLHALQQDETVAHGFVEAAIHLLLKVPLMLVALTVTARLMGISYGSLSIGLLKLAGLAMGPMALADVILSFILRETLGFGIWLGAFFYLIITGIPLSFMFDLEMNETMITLVVIVVLQVLFSFFLLTIILGMFA